MQQSCELLNVSCSAAYSSDTCLLLELSPDLIKLIIKFIPMFNMDLIMLKHTHKLLKKFVEQLYPDDHRYIAIQTDYTHTLKSIWHYLPPIQSMAQIHTLMDTSLKYDRLDNYDWLNNQYPTATPHHVLELLAKHNQFEVFKRFFQQSYGQELMNKTLPTSSQVTPVLQTSSFAPPSSSQATSVLQSSSLAPPSSSQATSVLQTSSLSLFGGTSTTSASSRSSRLSRSFSSPSISSSRVLPSLPLVVPTPSIAPTLTSQLSMPIIEEPSGGFFSNLNAHHRALDFEKLQSTYKLQLHYLDIYIMYAIKYQHLEMMDWCWMRMNELNIKLNHEQHQYCLFNPLQVLPVNENGDIDTSDDVGQYLSLATFRAAIESQNHTLIQWLYEKNPNVSFLLRTIECGDIKFTQEVYTRYDRSLKEPLTPQMMIKAAENNALETLDWLYALQCSMPDLDKISCPSIDGLTWLWKHTQGDKRFYPYHMECAARHGTLTTLQWLYHTHHVEPDKSTLVIALDLNHHVCAAWLWSLLEEINPTLLTETNWYWEISLNLKNYTWLRQHGCYIENYHQVDPSHHFTLTMRGRTKPKKIPTVDCYTLLHPSNHETFVLMQHLSQHLPWSKQGFEYKHAILNNRLDHIQWLHEHHCPLNHDLTTLALVKCDLSIVQWLDSHHSIQLYESFLYVLRAGRIYNALWVLQKNETICLNLALGYSSEAFKAMMVNKILPFIHHLIASHPIIDPQEAAWQHAWKVIYNLTTLEP